jgi:Zn-dependent protease
MDFQDLIFRLVIFLGPLILAISVHEFSHVAMARWLGDDLGTRMGRYTLDPLKHIDPIWTIALPALLITMSTATGAAGIPLFAAGKPAPYNPMGLNRRFNGKRISLRYAELLVAVAGPLSNLLLGFISICIIFTLLHFGFESTGAGSAIGLATQFLYLNVSLFVFNLIPVPPLDGSKVFVALLPRNLARRYEAVAMQLSFVLLGLLIFGGGALMASVIRLVVNLMTRPFV